jgi:hypothetical protein
VDENEADYLRRQILELRQARGRWQALALISLSVLALLILAGGATLLTGGLLMGQRTRMADLRALEAEMVAREEAERARAAELEARMRAEEAVRQAKEAGKAAEPGK